MTRTIDVDLGKDGITRRGLLRCMAWVGTGTVLALQGGLVRSALLAPDGATPSAGASTLNFVQLSDSHIGFSKDANPDVTATLREAVARVNALPVRPEFVLHTGDISHLSKAAEFDTAQQVLGELKTGRIFYVPGEHDVLTDGGAQYRARFGKGTFGTGWFSFDRAGAHFIGLVNVMDLKPGGLGALGAPQLEWLKRDLAPLPASTPIVVFAHVPLWTVYPAWGWGTDDGEQALSLLRRFGSLTVLNGHIHQVLQKVEGHATFHTAMSTAFPQPAPGAAASPGPMKVEASRLRSLLGLTSVRFVRGQDALALIDTPLDGTPAAATTGAAAGDDKPAAATVHIDNFTFSPPNLKVPAGTTVTWINDDDIPHTVTSNQGTFKSKPLDTGERFEFTFRDKGAFPYFCSIHPHMTGSITVQ